MSENTELISHPGIIKQINDDTIEVMVLSQSACSSCHAKGGCTMADMEEKAVFVEKQANTEYTVGQQVTVSLKKQLGTLAVFLGYIFPFIVMVATLIGMILAGFSEGIAGLTALVILIPYYLLIYILRTKINKKFSFYIK